jgi:hypothetical protein
MRSQNVQEFPPALDQRVAWWKEPVICSRFVGNLEVARNGVVGSWRAALMEVNLL